MLLDVTKGGVHLGECLVEQVAFLNLFTDGFESCNSSLEIFKRCVLSFSVKPFNVFCDLSNDFCFGSFLKVVLPASIFLKVSTEIVRVSLKFVFSFFQVQEFSIFSVKADFEILHCGFLGRRDSVRAEVEFNF